VTFLPKKFQKELSQIKFALVSLFESKLHDLNHKLSGEIDINGGLINEVKSQTDAQIVHMKRNNSDLLVI
jgi:hypothetical protein